MTTVAIDTNLLLLLVVGRSAPRLIGVHKRLKSYSSRDFNRLVEAIQRARQLLMIPHCLAEVSNLLGHGIADPLRSHLYQSFKSFIEANEELPVPSASAARAHEFIRLGLTDAVWLEVLDKKTTLVTDDQILARSAINRGLRVLSISAGSK